MKREQNEDVENMYMRIRLKKMLAGTSSFLDKYAPFRGVTDDKFFITIEASDPRFDREGAQSFLKEHGGINVAVVEE